jgi:hypothetical protein
VHRENTIDYFEINIITGSITMIQIFLRISSLHWQTLG